MEDLLGKFYTQKNYYRLILFFSNCSYVIFFSERILKLTEKYNKIKGWSKLNWSSSKGIWTQKQVDFQVEVNTLFDISVRTIIDMIMKDQSRTEDAKKEDAAFYKDQRSKRNMIMTAQHDEELEIKALRRK